MITTVLIKMEAESKEELEDTFAGDVEFLKNHYEEQKNNGVFGDPAKAELRYLIVCNKWKVE